MPVDEKFYEDYWTDEGQAQRGARHWTEHGFLTPHLQRMFEENIPQGATFLDVGCGDGRTTGVWAAATGRKYVGVDISSEAVARGKSAGLDVRKIEDASSLPFDDNSLRVVTCIEVFEHLFMPQATAAEILRVLEPNGLLIATTPNVAYWRRRLDIALFGRWNPMGDDLAVEQPWRDPHVRFFGAGTLARMLKQVGYRTVTVGGHEGTILGDIPVVRSMRFLEPREMYHRLESTIPSVFAKRLAAIARK
jgi:ubiquinone/menaquinone biosynthesis C-methylase UbiE